MEIDRGHIIKLNYICSNIGINNIFYDIIKYMLSDYANEYIIAELCTI